MVVVVVVVGMVVVAHLADECEYESESSTCYTSSSTAR